MKPYYSEGGITIYHADYRELLSCLPAVDLVLLDPPFGNNFAGQPTKWQRRAGYQAEDWDNAPLDNIHEVLRLGRVQIVWGGNYYSLPPSRGWLTWFKPDAPPSMASFELAWTNMDKNARQISQSIAATNAERLGHPTQKPLRVIEWSIAYADLAPNSLILDTCMGTGTTLRAAKNLGHRAIGVEVQEQYCEMAALRLSQGVMDFTGAPV